MEASFTFVFLPNRHPVFRFDVHRTLFRHVPCFVPCVNLRQSAVHTPAAERVGIGFRTLEDFLWADVSCPYIGVCEEEALCRAKTVADAQTLCFRLALFVQAER